MTDRPDTLSRRMLMRGAMGAAAIAGAAPALAQRDRKVAMRDDPKAMVAWLRAVARGYLPGPAGKTPGS